MNKAREVNRNTAARLRNQPALARRDTPCRSMAASWIMWMLYRKTNLRMTTQ